MKLGRLFVAVALAFSVSTVALGEDKKAADKDSKPAKKFTEGSCCDKAQKASKECKHPCCAEAAKKDEVCTKCNKPAEKK